MIFNLCPRRDAMPRSSGESHIQVPSLNELSSNLILHIPMNDMGIKGSRGRMGDAGVADQTYGFSKLMGYIRNGLHRPPIMVFPNDCIPR